MTNADPPTPGNLDSSATTANRPSRQVNVVEAGAAAPAHSPRNGAVRAEHDDLRARPRDLHGLEEEHVANVYQAPPVSAPSSGASRVHEQSFIPARSTYGELEEQFGHFPPQERSDTPSDDLSFPSDDYDSASEDTEMMSDSDTPPTPEFGKGKGVQAQNTPAAQPTMTTGTDRSYSYSDATRSRMPGGASSSNHRGSHDRWMLEDPLTPQPTFGKQGYPGLRRKPSMCIIAPSCAAELEEQKKREALESGRLSSYPGLCEVCRSRPRYTNSSGRVYATCGLRCAAERDPAKYSAGMCTVCKKRPKLATGTGKHYDQCSAACRDKAKAALANGMNFPSLV
ncbi:hypothetical protein H1R20_g1228, partial [Candolleomyces eurysporus]